MNQVRTGRLMRRTLIIICLVLAGLIGMQHARHLRLASVETASMRPVFAPGDMLLLAPVRAADLRRGDIVAYRSPRSPGEIITHRIVSMNTSQDMVTTQGDALKAADPAIRRQLVQAKAIAMIPQLGHLAMWLRTWPGLTLAVYLPAGYIFVSELRRLNRTHQSGRYRLLAR